MTEFDPFGVDDRRLMWRVLSQWMERSNHRKTQAALPPKLVAQLRAFTLIDHSQLQGRVPKLPLPLKLHSQGWLVGSPLPKREPKVVPIVTVSLGPIKGDRVTDAAFRVALLSEDRDEGTIHAEGWRFEQAEVRAEATVDDPVPGPPAHPYSHAQAIVGWVKGNDCLIHPPHSENDMCDGLFPIPAVDITTERARAKSSTLVSHPAFPLPATTLCGLSLSMIATLYGVRVAMEIVNDDTVLKRMSGQARIDCESLRIFE